MNKQEMIEKLKDNEVAWMFLTPDEQVCMKLANNQGKVENLKYCGSWESFGPPWVNFGLGSNEIWRIKPDYEPGPEYHNCEIFAIGKLVFGKGDPLDGPTSIHKLVSRRDFRCFWSPQVGVGENIPIGLVAAHVSYALRTVYARFAKE